MAQRFKRAIVAIMLELARMYNLNVSLSRDSMNADGKEIFDVLLVRCQKGIIFSELQEPVKTAFILIGSPDERNYHLRALMTVAHIVSEKGFEERWEKAKNPEQLRDIVLLSSRKRG